MVFELDPVEIRILGCLIEKQLTTPEYYPLTLNSLLAACNQKSNREPVMNLIEREVQQALKKLIDKYLVREKQLPGTRVSKYEHKLSGTLTKEYDFSVKHLAMLSVLFLRGPQTVGEIKGRTQRMAEFNDLEQVESCLQELVVHPKGPFVKALPRQAGRREIRYCHLLGGEIEDNAPSESIEYSATESEKDGLQMLRNEVQALRIEIEELKQQVNDILNRGN